MVAIIRQISGRQILWADDVGTTQSCERDRSRFPDNTVQQDMKIDQEEIRIRNGGNLLNLLFRTKTSADLDGRNLACPP